MERRGRERREEEGRGGRRGEGGGRRGEGGGRREEGGGRREEGGGRREESAERNHTIREDSQQLTPTLAYKLIVDVLPSNVQD